VKDVGGFRLVVDEGDFFDGKVDDRRLVNG